MNRSGIPDLFARMLVIIALVTGILATAGKAATVEARLREPSQAVMASAETARHLADIQTSASGLGLIGTPTFFINGRASASIQPADIDRAIRAAKAG